jgi:AraC-like DNA-binding protein
MAEPIKNISPINIARSAPGVFFGDVWYAPGGECGPRIQPDYQLVIVHLGEADVTFDDKRCQISRGHRTHHTWCTVNPGMVPAGLRKQLSGRPAALPQSEAFELLMKAAFSLRVWSKMGGPEMLTTLALTLLQEYVRMSESGMGETDRESPCERARRYLEKHCGDEDCLKKAAQIAAITPQHLIRLFRKHYRLTPGRYLWQTRVDQGVGLLAATGLTVSEIAERCGFKNPFHFSRLMKKMQGVSPRQLRERAVRRRVAP